MAEITIDDITPRVSYDVGTDPETEFTVPFVFFADGDLRVYAGGVLLAQGDDYTVAGAGDQGGGTVTLVEEVTETTVTIVRDVPVERLTDFPSSGAFKVAALNRELDRIIAIAQQQKVSLARALTLPEGEVGDAIALPALEDRAGRLLSFDADGLPTGSGVTAEAVEASVIAAVASGKVIVGVPPVVSDGTLTEIDTGYTLAGSAQAFVYVGGVYQRDYTVTGTKVVLPEAVPVGVAVRILVLGVSPDAPGGGNVALSDTTPQPLGSAAAGNSNEASRANHVHAMPTAAQVGAQAASTELAAIAALSSTGILERTGSNTWTFRPTGVSASTDLLTRADGDGRYALSSALSSYLPLAGGTVSGALTVTGNFTVNGTTTTVHSTTVTTDDNTIVLNNAEVGAGVTAGTAGIEIERGSVTNYQFVFDEASDLFKVGMVGSLQAVATREDTPTNGYYARWNASQSRFDAIAPATVRSDIGAGTSNVAISATAAQALGATAAAGSTGQAADAGHIHQRQLESIIIACGDESTAITAGTAKVSFRMPYAMTLTAVRASLVTAQTSGSIFTVNVKKNGTTIFSTKITIDNTELSSFTAAVAAVLSTTALADDDLITVDVDQVGDGTAKGLKVALIGRQSA